MRQQLLKELRALKMQYAIERVRCSPVFKEIIKQLEQGRGCISLEGISGSLTGFLAAALSTMDTSILIITYNDAGATEIYEGLRSFTGQAYRFPSHQCVLYNAAAQSTDTERARIEVMDAVVKQKAVLVVASVQSLLFPVMNRSRYIDNTFDLEVGQLFSMEELVRRLIAAGYEREDMVEGAGQFSVRGGIIDIFPVSGGPYRIEFFDNEVDSIRVVDISNQRSVQKVRQVSIPPCRELLLDNREKEAFIQNIRNDVYGNHSKIKTRIRTEEMDNITALLEARPNSPILSNYWMYGCYAVSLADYFDCGSLVIVDNPVRVEDACKKFYKEFIDHYIDMMEKGRALYRQKERLLTYEQMLSSVRKRQIITFDEILSSGMYHGESYTLTVKSIHPFYGKIDFAIQEINRLKQEEYLIYIFVSAKSRGDILEEELKKADIFPVMYPTYDNTDVQGGTVIIDTGDIRNGFTLSEARLAVVTETDIFGAFKRKKRGGIKRRSNGIKIFTELSTGDYVVHETQGIGVYNGIHQLKVEGIKRDYLKIEYRGGDILYLPTYQSHLIQKYVGAEGKRPRLSKMGGKEWAKTKASVKKAIQNMARELLQLYAVRQYAEGYCFNEDTTWQRQFEDLFPFQETPDQLRCIEEVKKDMELSRPMDRLLCGDVGYGKTEVAMRAAFKAVIDGKQVAMLVPTTILAQQHFNTFTQRMEQFPVNIDVVSRFRTVGEQLNILRRIKEGNIDIIIGTHRLLQGDISYNDLGLLIVDEEQRFGVTHKERIKTLKKNVDVLTLTATPIPRTLHMSLAGIRDISLLQDPPEDRLPVETYVVEYNDGLIRDAVLRELNRNGQVYFVHNRVKSICKLADDLKRIVPEASVAIAHGQMQERELENIMMDFLNKRYDVLVCTTIIETGLDMPNVNTIIVTDADKLGLSQMYQLRGRVGRSSRLAYAYFTYKKNKVLTEAAEKRLKSIKEFTEFGSGFKIALRDLEIRGTGNILGIEQHGHMMMVGYDLYSKLLEQTIKELKGIQVEEKVEPILDLKVDAYIPASYIYDEKQKVEIYRRIAAIESIEDCYDVEEEIEDRFGDIVAPVRHLIVMSYIKALCQRLQIISIEQKTGRIRLQFKDKYSIKPDIVSQLMEECKRKIKFEAVLQPCFIFSVQPGNPDRLLLTIKAVLEKIIYFHGN